MFEIRRTVFLTSSAEHIFANAFETLCLKSSDEILLMWNAMKYVMRELEI